MSRTSTNATCNYSGFNADIREATPYRSRAWARLSRRRAFGNGLSLLLAGLCVLSWATPQAAPTKDQVEARRSVRSSALAREARDAQRVALDKAVRLGWQTKGKTADGRSFELIGLGSNGEPRYRATCSTNATITANAKGIQEGLEPIDGSEIVIGVWDDGAARSSHQEFMTTGATRAINMDGAAVSAHATSVTGVAIAGGKDSTVVGSASRAIVHNYDWVNDLAEVVGAASATATDPADGKLQVSNHSYGTILGWCSFGTGASAVNYWLGAGYTADGSGFREDLDYGRYSDISAELDQISFDAAYYLRVQPVGNDRTNAYTGLTDGTGTFYYFDTTSGTWQAATYRPATAPNNGSTDNGGYDTLLPEAVAKNVLSVGAVTDAVTAGQRDPSVSTMTSFSSWGPTDDGRVKPDVVADGQKMRTVSYTGNAKYGLASGTSFSGPSAAGVVALLLDGAANRFPGWAPHASTLKALVIHSATDMGRPGPDYVFGWGLVDAAAGVSILDTLADPDMSRAFPLVEGTLDATNPSNAYVVEWDGLRDFTVTICWTDAPGPAMAEVLDSRTPSLVNDLDLRIEGAGSTFYPWVLDPTAPAANATRGDNIRDNVEQVRLTAGGPAGTYTIRVSHKGTLTGGSQSYTLVATGQSPASATPSPLILTGSTPALGFAGSQVLTSVQGSTFLPDTQLFLRRDGRTDIQATVTACQETELEGVFDLADAEAGAWDIVVVRPDGAQGVLPGGFEVQAAIAPTSSPSPSPTPSLTPSPTPSLTPSPTPTLTPSPTPSPSPSLTPEPSPTASLTPTPSPTPSLTPTPSPTATYIPSPTPVDSSKPPRSYPRPPIWSNPAVPSF